MGVERFQILRSRLSADTIVVGIDEHTALFMDCRSNLCRVMGRGGVTLLRGDTESRWIDGQEFSLESLGTCRTPPLGQGIAPPVWSSAVRAQTAVNAEPTPSADVMTLVREREDARARRDWAAADRLRARIQALGWQVKDTPEGSQLTPA